MLEGIWLVSYVALWILVFLEAAAILALARQVGLLHLHIRPAGALMANSGPELGERAPQIAAHDLNNNGQPVALGVFAGKSTLLVFISPGCSSCDELMPGVMALQQHEQKTTDIILVSDITNERVNQEFIERNRLQRIKYIISPETTEEYRIGGSPYAVLVSPNGIVITKGLVNHLDHLESLLNAKDSGFPSHDSRMNALVTASRERADGAPAPEGGINVI